MNKVDFKGSVILNPVPVVLITSKNKNGDTNVFTVAWTGTVCTKPPMLSISVRPERLSYEYIKETMEFTVNVPNYNLVKQTDFCGVRSGRDVNKIKELGFTMIDGEKISVPYINECPINIECKVTQIISLGSHDMILAEVVSSHIDNSLIDDSGKIHFEEAKLISYCHGEYYPMSKFAIGKFGFSVAKNKKLIEEYSKYDRNYKKLTATPEKSSRDSKSPKKNYSQKKSKKASK
ncbi:flavin reductase family protein [Inconstantimicrobium mannanitabidum]|uniref:Flavin reductase n=1 Tax=Inconstantimicrobium mannanitabidum TaxID=1604901 RepID=A0ACB5RGA4_9CLOT|nr:flavin reductase family protein [Clostridium sp. TW13]GKX68117.1 flavin reductase [Clostridium sp. TW13]